MPDPAYVDTNILLRHFLRDDPDKTAAVAAFLAANAEGEDIPLVVVASTISEVVFVARGATYRIERQGLVRMVELLLDGPFALRDRDVIVRALDLYRDNHDDWDDCLLAAYALERSDGTVVSFDRGLDRIPGLTRIEPRATRTNG